jgi:hypothetical protein
MSENQTITHEELEKQVEEAYKEREKLFRSTEQMTEQTTMKVKIIDEEARKLFPELARDLEVNGLINDVCIDEDGFPHDGLKRIRLLGLEQIKALGKVKIVPRDSKCENIPLTKKARIQHLKWSYEYFSQNAKFGDKVKIADILAKRYGIHRATVYRWLGLIESVSNETNLRKPRKSKDCSSCTKVKGLEEALKIKDDSIIEWQQKYVQALKDAKERISDSQLDTEEVIQLFLKKHPNKELTQLGSFQDKLTA